MYESPRIYSYVHDKKLKNSLFDRNLLLKIIILLYFNVV
jgi:hypothetical protein